VALLFSGQEIIIECMRKVSLPYLIFFSTAAVTGLLLYFFLYPSYSAYFPKCLFFTFTGFYCPGCGSQRAMVALLHADILAALHNNILFVLSLPFLIYSFIVFMRNTLNKNKIKLRFFYDPLFVKIVIVLVIAFSILRNIPSYPFTLLAPL